MVLEIMNVILTVFLLAVLVFGMGFEAALFLGLGAKMAVSICVFLSLLVFLAIIFRLRRVFKDRLKTICKAMVDVIGWWPPAIRVGERMMDIMGRWPPYKI